jgi:hypothetical protein
MQSATVCLEKTMNETKCRQILDENLFQVQMTLDWGEDLRSNRTMTPRIQPKQRWNCFRKRMWKSLSGPSYSPDLNPIENLWKDLNPIENLWKDLKIAVDRRFRFNLRAWENLQRRMEKNQMSKADTDIPKATQICNHRQRCFYIVLTGVNTFNTFSKKSKHVSSLSLWGIVCRWMRKKHLFNPRWIQAVTQQNVELVKRYEYFLKALYMKRL